MKYKVNWKSVITYLIVIVITSFLTAFLMAGSSYYQRSNFVGKTSTEILDSYLISELEDYIEGRTTYDIDDDEVLEEEIVEEVEVDCIWEEQKEIFEAEIDKYEIILQPPSDYTVTIEDDGVGCSLDLRARVNEVLVNSEHIEFHPAYEGGVVNPIYLNNGHYITDGPYEILDVDIFSGEVYEVVNLEELQPLEVTGSYGFYFEGESYLIYAIQPYGLGCGGSDDACDGFQEMMDQTCEYDIQGVWIYNSETRENTRVQRTSFSTCP